MRLPGSKSISNRVLLLAGLAEGETVLDLGSGGGAVDLIAAATALGAIDQMLAIASHFVGQLIALQDHRKVTPQEAMQIVTANLAEGNRSIVQQLLGKTGGTA